MVLTNAYLTVQELRDVLRDQLTGYEAEYERAIASASRQIDDYCGRHFWMEASPVARLFRAEHSHVLFTSDIATATGLVVETDDSDDGTFSSTPWSATDYELEPFERMNGRPYTRIVAVGTKRFPSFRMSRSVFSPTWLYASGPSSLSRSRRARVRITAKWGWPEVPWQVKQACSILAVGHFHAKDAQQIAAQYGSGVGRFRDATATNFGKSGPHFSNLNRIPQMEPEAERLLSPLRVTVVA